MTGCRLCRRAPKLEESDTNIFWGFLDPRDHANLVRIKFSSNLPQELRTNVEEFPGNESQTFGKMDFNTFVKNCAFIIGLEEIV